VNGLTVKLSPTWHVSRYVPSSHAARRERFVSVQSKLVSVRAKETPSSKPIGPRVRSNVSRISRCIPGALKPVCGLFEGQVRSNIYCLFLMIPATPSEKKPNKHA
jgi:hypothetical protein